MENIDATDANRRRKDEVMKNVQIPYELFVSLLRYHLMEDNDCLDEIRQGLEQKLDSLVRHELYAKYKDCAHTGRSGKSQTGISG